MSRFRRMSPERLEWQIPCSPSKTFIARAPVLPDSMPSAGAETSRRSGRAVFHEYHPILHLGKRFTGHQLVVCRRCRHMEGDHVGRTEELILRYIGSALRDFRVRMMACGQNLAAKAGEPLHDGSADGAGADDAHGKRGERPAFEPSERIVVHVLLADRSLAVPEGHKHERERERRQNQAHSAHCRPRCRDVQQHRGRYGPCRWCG